MTSTIEGFKNTEVGVIPEDWEVKTLGCIAQINMGQSPDSKFYKSYKTGLPLIQGNADLKNKKQVIRFWSSQITKTCDEGDIIMTVRAPVGAIGLSTERSCIGRGVCSLKANNVEQSFLYFSLEFKESEWKILEQGSTFAAANSNQIKGFQIPLPPTKAEQTAIATVLNDTDALITQLEKLIAKKKAIKQGAMQELLKPKEGWETKTLGEIGECIIGLTYSPSNVKKEGKLVLRSSNIKGNKLVFDNNVFVDVDVNNRIITRKTDILICVRNGSRNLIGKCAFIDGRGVGETFGAFMSVFRSPYNEYIFHVLQSHCIHTQIEETIGATINQLTNKNLNSFVIPFPNTSEQKEIALILSDMDVEILKLENKLEKQKQLKQGMMQSLLTGKIRLV